MGYNKTTWQTGDTVIAEKLNNMENGIADSATMIINVSEQGVMDKTWSEVMSALHTGKRVIIINEGESYIAILNVTDGGIVEGDYRLSAYYSDNTTSLDFVTNSEDGYPTYSGWQP